MSHSVGVSVAIAGRRRKPLLTTGNERQLGRPANVGLNCEAPSSSFDG